MGVRVIYDEKQNMAAIYCSTVGVVFGPAIEEGEGGVDAGLLAEKFLQWLPQDARLYSDNDLMGKWYEFHALGWRECPECLADLAEAAFDACKKCREQCELCGDKGVETRKVKSVVDGTEIEERLCKDCEEAEK